MDRTRLTVAALFALSGTGPACGKTERPAISNTPSTSGGSGGAPECADVDTDLPVEYASEGGEGGEPSEFIGFEPQTSPLPAWAAQEGLAPFVAEPGGVCCPPGEYFIELTRAEQQTLFLASFFDSSLTVPSLSELDGERSLMGCEESTSSCMSVTEEDLRLVVGAGPVVSFEVRGLRVWVEGHSSVFVGEFWAVPEDGSDDALSGRFRVCYAGRGYT
jgi:hypothetical protein